MDVYVVRVDEEDSQHPVSVWSDAEQARREANRLTVRNGQSHVVDTFTVGERSR